MSHSRTKPFARLWRNSTFVYLIGVVIASYVCSRADLCLDVPFGLPFAALGMAFVSLGFLAIYTGEVSIKGASFYQSQNPILYWFFVAMILFIGIILFLPAIIPIGH